jgi:surfactin synthase thioesterase subunit
MIFRAQAAQLEVPVYMFVGRHDVNAMSSLAQEYFNVLQAPHKELLWLEGGHGLDDSTLPLFICVMVDKVLASTYPSGQ